MGVRRSPQKTGRLLPRCKDKVSGQGAFAKTTNAEREKKKFNFIPHAQIARQRFFVFFCSCAGLTASATLKICKFKKNEIPCINHTTLGVWQSIGKTFSAFPGHMTYAGSHGTAALASIPPALDGTPTAVTSKRANCPFNETTWPHSCCCPEIWRIWPAPLAPGECDVQRFT